MAKDEVLFTLENAPEDKDYEDVYRIHLEAERKDRKIALITCIVLAVVCIVLLIVLRNISFLFYAAGCVLVGIAYIKVDSNRKFIATNRLMMGEKQVVTFSEHFISVEEQYDSDEAFGEMVDEDAEENEDNAVILKTSNMMAYENQRGFLFADGKISNLFLYIPKRDRTEEELENLQTFAKERCSKGYATLEMTHLVDEDDEELLEAVASSHKDEREQYYGFKRKNAQAADVNEDDFPDELLEDAAVEDCDCGCDDSDCDCDDCDDFDCDCE